jgi:hypothetical protein
MEALNNLNLGLLLENDHGCVLVPFVPPHRDDSAEYKNDGKDEYC